MAKLRAAIITDIHYGLDNKDKLGSKAPKMMEQFIRAVNKYKPDLIVDMGDRVSSITGDAEDDRCFMKKLKQHFNKAAAPIYSLIGNHDIAKLTREENEKIMGSPSGNYTKDIGGIHIVFWNPLYRVSKTGIEVEEKDIAWLKRDLASTKKPTVVFNHVPLDNLNGEERDPVLKYFFWTQGEEIRKVMEDAGNVILVMGGHRHRNRHREINGIHYITQQSFTSMWREHYRVPSRTHSFLEIEDDGKLTVKLRGKFKKDYELTPKMKL